MRINDEDDDDDDGDLDDDEDVTSSSEDPPKPRTADPYSKEQGVKRETRRPQFKTWYRAVLRLCGRALRCSASCVHHRLVGHAVQEGVPTPIAFVFQLKALRDLSSGGHGRIVPKLLESISPYRHLDLSRLYS